MLLLAVRCGGDGVQDPKTGLLPTGRESPEGSAGIRGHKRGPQLDHLRREQRHPIRRRMAEDLGGNLGNGIRRAWVIVATAAFLEGDQLGLQQWGDDEPGERRRPGGVLS